MDLNLIGLVAGALASAPVWAHAALAVTAATAGVLAAAKTVALCTRTKSDDEAVATADRHFSRIRPVVEAIARRIARPRA